MTAQMKILREVSQIMSSSLELNSVFERVMHILAVELGIETGHLVVLDDVTGQLRIHVSHGLSSEEAGRGIYSVGEGIIGQVYQTGEARVVPDVRTDPDYLDRTGRRKGSNRQISFICLPVTSEGRTVGVLSADKLYESDEALEHDRRLLEVISAMVSQVVRINGMVMNEKETLVHELAELRKTIAGKYQFSSIVGSSQAMLEVFKTIDQVAETRATVLLMGETGTGKEMIAKAIHYNSDRKDQPFIRVNCGALSGQLLESELFGHVKGAFTGAIRDKVGRFEAAHDGTLFLDEIGTLEMPLQVKLLRVLQEREFERVGDHHTHPCDVRIIAAANLDLEEEVRQKRFREDLFYRLNVVAIRLPPLRERRQDIPQLIDFFLDKYNAENARTLRLISRDLLNLLMRYPWPGNVRELENAIERGVVLSRDENFTEDLLPLAIRIFAEQGRPAARTDSPEELMRRLVCQVMDEEAPAIDGSIWSRVSDAMERVLIEEAMKRCDQVKLKAADYLGINRNTLNKKYQELELERSAPEPAGVG